MGSQSSMKPHETAESRPTLSVVLPAYNEEACLSDAVQTYLDYFRDAGMNNFQIVIVDDGSRDGTGRQADELAAAHGPRVVTIHHPRNLGHPAAMLHGFQAASGKIVTHNGVDLPFHPRDIAKVLPLFDDGADVVVVERADRSAYGITRKVVSWSNILLLRTLFNTPVRDHNFVQFYRREVLDSIETCSNGVSTVTVELILRAYHKGYRLRRITAEYYKRSAGKSTITAGKTLAAFVETIRLWRSIRSSAAELRG